LERNSVAGRLAVRLPAATGGDGAGAFIRRSQ
jgi:hypothetical protein